MTIERRITTGSALTTHARWAVACLGVMSLTVACGTSTGGTGTGTGSDTDKGKIASIPVSAQSGGGESADIPKPSCASPHQIKGVLTCADLEKAKSEGTVTLYSPDPEPQTQKLMAEFQKDFPGIDVKIVYLQTGALYARLLSERDAGVHKADVLINTDLATINDFEKKKGWQKYISPELRAYPDKQFRSDPPGLWQDEGNIFGGIVYNTDKVKASEAPKDWKDLTDSRWKGRISYKSTISGLQHLQWYDLRHLYGDEYWDKIAELEPRAFDSYVQQYDRIISGDDLVVGNAQYSGYVEYKERGAPLGFVAPPSGMPTGLQAIGIPTKAPHPEAAKLLLDWYLSERGQKLVTKYISLTSARTGVAPPGNPADTKGSHLLTPKQPQDYIDTQAEFNRSWNRVVGVSP